MQASFNGVSFIEMKAFLDEKACRFNASYFIDADPISIPHRFRKKEDIEIAAFLAASIAWGNRKSIVNNASKMMMMMDESPYDFVTNYTLSDLKRLKGFVHRTFNSDDFVQFVRSLNHIYKNYGGLEDVFANAIKGQSNSQNAIAEFKRKFFEGKHLARTEKHISDPTKGSSAKRLNMFLRWMVRNDANRVDFGIWKDISPSVLSIPLDVHTGNVARKLGLLQRQQNDWRAVQELDGVLRAFDSSDPVRYDFALFGLGAIEKF